jgi:hypothetical protein
MATTHIAEARRAFAEIAAGTTPAALERFKLERLFELRAVIDALRSERGPVPPLGTQITDARPRQ